MIGESRNRLLGVLLAAVLVALGVLAYIYYERTKPVAKIDLPGVSGEITKEGVDTEVGKRSWTSSATSKAGPSQYRKLPLILLRTQTQLFPSLKTLTVKFL